MVLEIIKTKCYTLNMGTINLIISITGYKGDYNYGN